MNLLAVAVGGALGSLGRYYLSLLLNPFVTSLFPWPTLIANVLGSFCIGILNQAMYNKSIPAAIRLGLGTGILGGFTTFSTYSLEVISLVKTGHVNLAVVYAVISLILGLAACFTGVKMIESIQQQMKKEHGGNR